jgi:thiaminase/transcriptional activator TenA
MQAFDPDPPMPAELVIPPFAQRCLDACREEWEQAVAHPFVRALIAGDLSKDRFRFYQMQDARYLEAYADTCSILSTRFVDPADKLWFIDGARLAIVVEQQLHAGYGHRLGYTAADVAALDCSPDNRAYQNHMLQAAHRASLIEALAALAPCPWLYTDIGIRMMDELGSIPEDHPWGDWLQTYADPSFIRYTSELLGIMQRVADDAGPSSTRRAIEAFRLSVRHEWMFWEQAWTLQDWPTSTGSAIGMDGKKQKGQA